MTKSLRKNLTRIIIAAVLFVAGILLPIEGVVRFVLFLAIYAYIGWDIVWKALRNIAHGKIFDENFLMAVATVGAFGLGDYPEGVAVMLFYQIGSWFEKYALGRSRRSIASLMDIRPDYANLQKEDGSVATVTPEEVQINDIIVVKAGERIPLDGVIIEGASTVDTAALTGESAPQDKMVDDEIISGCINLTGTIKVRVSKVYGESTVAKILDLVENSSSKKSKAEHFISRFAKYYTPFVFFSAVALALVPPLLMGQEFSVWVYRAFTFLVISCPCALVISVPLSFFGGIGGASKEGVLVKGGNYLEALSKTETIVFDKTGTLTTGTFAVSDVAANGVSKDELLKLAAYAEHYSNHPIAVSIKKAYGKDIDTSRIATAQEQAGYGIKAEINGKEILAGNGRMMEQAAILYEKNVPAGTVIHLAEDGQYRGYLLVEDVVKPDAARAIASLKRNGVKQTVMLTGDIDAVGQKVAKELGLDKAYTQLLPDGKVEKVEELLREVPDGATLAFVGDGINDAPVLARADIGIAMGGLGSDAAIEAADVVIMTDEPSKIAVVMKISRKTLRIVKQNIVFALGIKTLVLVLGAFGIATMWAAVFADVGVSVIAIVNAMRALNTKDCKE